MFVKHRFMLDHMTEDYLQSLIPPFGYDGFGELIFYRTYSRVMRDGGQESWADCITRVTNGTFSIRKDFYIKNRIPWDEGFWQEYAKQFAIFMYKMKWLPPGRGLWAMGSDFVYERGAMALYNCAYTNLGNNLEFDDDIAWLMDSLMQGVGVGFGPVRDGLKLKKPRHGYFDYEIPDTREGWVEATRLILRAYLLGEQLPYLIYDRVRPAGLPIKGFGGISSGPEPLKKMHIQIAQQCERLLAGEMDIVEFKTNVANLVGCCVVAGNVRRSAEIACGSVNDQMFLNLKNYKLYPHRAEFGWMSNNSAILRDDVDFDQLGEIARRVTLNGEPGVINAQNLVYGRVGKKQKRLREDQAVGFNPCGEIPLEHREVCNLSETLPTMCEGPDEWYKACEYATFYSSTVSLLPTHQPSTNRVVARNRRIGVGLIDFTGWKHSNGVHKVTKWLRNGYNIVTETNKWLNSEAGVPEAIRKTCVKPGGTTPKLPGKTSGAGYPTHIFTLRRVRVQQDTQFHELLVKAGIPNEADIDSANTDCFEYPIVQGPAKPADEVTIWEQANNIVLLQREWADNAVSNTIYFKPKWRLIQHSFGEDVGKEAETHIGLSAMCRIFQEKQTEYVTPEYKLEFKYKGELISELKIYEFDPRHEEDSIEAVLSSIIPLVKSISLLPHTPKGVYHQIPEEGISQEEYNLRKSQINPIDWSELRGSDGQDERYCQGETCVIPQPR
jgi:ribonucleoside-triphosphate reductase (thioredoxin)